MLHASVAAMRDCMFAVMRSAYPKAVHPDDDGSEVLHAQALVPHRCEMHEHRNRASVACPTAGIRVDTPGVEQL